MRYEGLEELSHFIGGHFNTAKGKAFSVVDGRNQVGCPGGGVRVRVTFFLFFTH